MKTSDIREKFEGIFDTISQRKGIWTGRRGFFYTHGDTAQHYVNAVLAEFPNTKIVDSGEVWKPFRGGASVATSSHFFVKFELADA